MKPVLAAVAIATGCLGPQVDDVPSPSGDLVPPGTEIPSIDTSSQAAAALAAHDGVEGVVARHTAFAAGAPIHLWDFGAAPALAAPMYVVMARQPGGAFMPLSHPPIVDVIPGDASYSPYREVFALVVTDAYRGELITSAAAIGDAVAAGLIEEPALQATAVNYPAVASDIRLNVGTSTPIAPTSTFYYRHQTVTYFDFGPMLTYEVLRVPIAPRYVLRREGHEALSEPIRRVDLDGDGDAVDTNDILERSATDPLRSPLCRTVHVVVPETTASIDTTGSDAVADIMSASQLFAPAPVAGTVLAYEPTDELRNCAVQRTTGGL